METYIDAAGGGYWGLNPEDWDKWVRYCDTNGITLELHGVNEEGEFYYRMRDAD